MVAMGLFERRSRRRWVGGGEEEVEAVVAEEAVAKKTTRYMSRAVAVGGLDCREGGIVPTSRRR